MDDLDVTLIGLFSREPRVGVLEASRRLGSPGAPSRPGWTGSFPRE